MSNPLTIGSTPSDVANMDVTETTESPKKLKPSLKTITRQNALIIDDSKPVVKKQLSFPDDLPHYHEPKSKTDRLRRAVSTTNSGNLTNTNSYYGQFEFCDLKLDAKLTKPRFEGKSLHLDEDIAMKKSKQKTKKKVLKQRSSSAVVVSDRNVKKNGQNGVCNSSSTRLLSLGLSRGKDVNIKRSSSVTDIFFKKPINSSSNVRKMELSSLAHANRSSIKRSSKSLVKQLSLPETMSKTVSSRLQHQASVTSLYSKEIRKPVSANAAFNNIYKVPKRQPSHDKASTPLSTNQNAKQTNKTLPKFKRSISDVTKTGQSTSNDSNLEDLLSALQVKPASKFSKQSKSAKDRSTKAMNALPFPEVSTMVADVSPVLSDIEISEQNNSWTVPIGITSKVLRPAFLGRTISPGSSSRVSSAISTKSISPTTPPPDIPIVLEDSKTEALSEEQTETEQQNLIEVTTQVPPAFQIPTIIIQATDEELTNQTEEFYPESIPPSDETASNSSDSNTLSPIPQKLLKQESVCLSMHQKLKENGVDVSLQTLQRALMTPTEFRMVHHARRAQSCILTSRAVR